MLLRVHRAAAQRQAFHLEPLPQSYALYLHGRTEESQEHSWTHGTEVLLK